MTSSAVGLNTVIGVGEESTWNTAVTPDRFYEFTSESLDRTNRTLSSNAIRPGSRNVRRGSRRVLTGREGGGDLELEVATTQFGRWFKHIMGGTPTNVQQGATAAYLQTHTFGSLRGKSLTVQKSIRDADSNELESFTFTGTKVLSAEFSISVDQILTLALSLDAADVKTDVAAASPSYTDVSLFHFAQGALKVDGSTVAAVTDASVKVTNSLKTDSYYIGSSGVKAEQQDNDFPSVEGSLSAEFLSPTVFYDRFAADTSAALVLEFIGSNIASTYYRTVRLTMPDVRFTGEAPKVGGPDVIVSSVPFEAFSTGSSSGLTIEYMTVDTSP